MHTIRKARKEHRCTLCGAKIRKGELHVYQRLTPWDHEANDNFFDYRVHGWCNTAWDRIGPDWDWELPYLACDFRQEALERFPEGEFPFPKD